MPADDQRGAISDCSAEVGELGEDGVGVGADSRRRLDEACEDLGLEPGTRRRHDLVEQRRRLERLRIDEEQLLLDAERERRRATPAHSVRITAARTACTGRPAASQA